MPAPLPDLTKRDFEDHVLALVSEAQRLAPTLCNSWFEGDLGKVLLDLIAWDTTGLGFIGDVQFREVYPDTLRLRESILHYSRLFGYYPRRSVPASLRVQALVSQPTTAPDVIRIRRGQRVNVSNGQSWEVASDYVVQPGTNFPTREVLRYGDLKYNTGTSSDPALIQLRNGEARAYLVDINGDRLPSTLNFTGRLSAGTVLKLSSQLIGSTFGSSPDRTRSEFAVLSVGSLPGDAEAGAVLYLDREWNQDDWIGKWSIEDRCVVVTNSETFTETTNLPAEEAERKNLIVAGSFFPVIDNGAGSYRSESALEASLEARFNGNGVIVVVNGAVWEETASLLLESSDALVYETDFDQDDKLQIKFGDGVRGALLPEGTVTIEYRIGGGIRGNLRQGEFSGVVSGFINGEANSTVSVSLTNPYTQGSGGMERETLSELKANLRRFIQTNSRGVTPSDYESLATGFSSGTGKVALARAVRRSNLVPREQNIVWLHLWVNGPDGRLIAPDESLKSQLLPFLERRKMVNDEVILVDGESTAVPIIVRYRYQQGVPSWQARELLSGAIARVIVAQRPGIDFDISSLYHAIREVKEIETVTFDSPERTLEAGDSVLFTNSLTIGRQTKLSMGANKDDTSIVPADTSLFAPGTTVVIFEPNKDLTTAVVDQVGGGVVSFRSGKCTVDYSTAAEVFNTDFIEYGWSRERTVSVFVTFTSQLPPGMPNPAVRFNLQTFFSKVLKPGQTILRSTLETIVGSVPGIASVSVRFDQADSSLEEIKVGSDEISVLHKLVINGVVS